MEEISRRQEFEILRNDLTAERQSYVGHWRDIADNILPRRPMFVLTDTNRGERKNQRIVDSTATLAARTLRSGMMSGVTSPARPWFRLTTPDPRLSEFGPVKEWLYTVTERMGNIFLRSNVYNALPLVYGDIGIFGTAALGVEEDFDDVIRCTVFPTGSYMFANDDRGKVRVFMREFRLTVRQLVAKFGGSPIDWTRFSVQVKNYYDRKQMDTWIDVVHVIKENRDFNPNSLTSKRYESVYYERGTTGAQSADDGRLLSDRGYDYFPVLCPRWELSGEDVYGSDCPGMTALGDVKALQVMQKRKAQAIEKMVNPPLKGPSALRTQKVSLIPGDITYLDEREGQKGLSPIHEVNPRIQELSMDILEHQNRIRRCFYEDLFLMLANTTRREITAREIDERHEEKLLALGPVLEQLNQDLLDPLIDVTFDIMNRQGMIPPAPQELQGMALKVEYVSIMAMAQKMVGIAGVERFAGFVGQVIQTTQNPSVLDKVDIDQLIDVYGDLTSIPPGIVRPDEVVAEIRQGRADAQKQMQQMQEMSQGAQMAKDLAGADMSGRNALTALAEQANAGGLV